MKKDTLVILLNEMLKTPRGYFSTFISTMRSITKKNFICVTTNVNWGLALTYRTIPVWVIFWLLPYLISRSGRLWSLLVLFLITFIVCTKFIQTPYKLLIMVSIFCYRCSRIQLLLTALSFVRYLVASSHRKIPADLLWHSPGLVSLEWKLRL